MQAQTFFSLAAFLALGSWLGGAPVPMDKPVLELEFHPKGVAPSGEKVTLTPREKVLREGGILALPIKLRSEARGEVKTVLAREWHGGEWPATNLFASVTPAGEKKDRAFVPVYLAGEDPGVPPLTVVKAGETLEVKVRVDWPGTGSVKTSPLIEKPGEYRVEILLVFEADGKRQYVRGPATTVYLLEK
jgi:hypothetical protein